MLRLEGIVKRFGGVTALDGVDFEIGANAVHALVGENGAGKTTLIRIVTGACRPDAGRITLDAAPIRFDTPAAAHAAGIVAVHQETPLLLHRTVAENVLLGREPRRFGLVHWRAMFERTAALLAGYGIDLDPRGEVAALTPAERQLVAIARGVSLGARVLVLDEPSSSLAAREVELLFRLIRQVRAGGTAVVYISHRFDELYAICDCVTVLRDGRHVATRPLAGLERHDLVRLMLGSSRESTATRAATRGNDATRERAADAVPFLRVRSLRRGPRVRDVSFDVGRGSVVGLAGLLGAGRSETARIVFGADAADDGTIAVDGAAFAPRGPRHAIAAGLAFLPEDRKLEGIIPELSVRENLTLAALPALTRYGIVDRRRQRAIVEEYMRRLRIRAASADQPIRELSGGNQQKVLLARWLCTHPALLIADEPTRGVDIGARREIQTLIAELAAGGLTVLLISSDLEEIEEGSTRVVVLRDGCTVAELGPDEISADAIIRAMAGDAGKVPG